MKLTWFGHSCVLLEGSRKVLIDPFIPEGSIDVEPDVVAVTHGHADHMGDAASYGVPVGSPSMKWRSTCGRKVLRQRP